jgi:hypothetical protein
LCKVHNVSRETVMRSMRIIYTDATFTTKVYNDICYT